MHKSKTLDPVLLGRPLPALKALAILLSQHVTQQIQASGHRSLELAVEDAELVPCCATSAAPTTPTQVRFARTTVLQLMALRYGFETTADTDPTTPRTRTEERIDAALQARVAEALALCLAPVQHVQAVATTQRWQWQASLRVGQHPAEMLCIALGPAQSAQLEFLINQQRPRHNTKTPKPEPLLIDLHAFLLEKTVTAADLQNLHVGSILPITLERARIALNGQAMLTASVAEHQGKLHLTAFETLE